MLFSKPTLLLLCLFEAPRDWRKWEGGLAGGLRMLAAQSCRCDVGTPAFPGRSCILSCPGSALPPCPQLAKPASQYERDSQ